MIKHRPSSFPSSAAPRGPRAGGFTLVELLAVLLILGILFTFLVSSSMKSSETVKMKATQAFISTIAAELEDYAAERGDYPLSTFPDKLDPKPSTMNMGSEMLVIALWPADGKRQAAPAPEERLGNTDGDRTGRTLTSFTNPESFELVDDWGNPIAYFHRKDFAASHVYVTFDNATSETVDQSVRAATSAKTGDPFNKRSFQLISAGPDGLFGTSDDVCNFNPES